MYVMSIIITLTITGETSAEWISKTCQFFTYNFCLLYQTCNVPIKIITENQYPKLASLSLMGGKKGHCCSGYIVLRDQL